jgi:hypothetical protein
VKVELFAGSGARLTFWSIMYDTFSIMYDTFVFLYQTIPEHRFIA